jgi:hypothetical protein
MESAPVQIPLRRKYTARKVVKHVSSKGGGNTASLGRKRHAHLPPVKNTAAPAPPPTMVVDAGSGKRRWARG